ncbi:hypothetical protein [Alkalibacterium gilvum]|uniref:hypothetical protein n=1 Tax=Alkalibacterium gilvum TaxID=1130080 RepID=UPI003F8E34C2
MKKKTIWTLAIGYALITFLFHNILETLFGEILMQISYIGLFFFVVWLTYSIISFGIKQLFYNRKHRK